MIPIVSYYTKDTPYAQEVQGMKDSAERLDMFDLHILPVQNLGNWEANCQQKADVLCRVADALDYPFLYVDADARFQSVPHLFKYGIDKDYDIAVHYFRGHELLSGTIWINPTLETKSVLEEWRIFNKERPKEWDQRTLQRVINQSPKLRILRLPCEYCYIFDLSQKYYPECNPTIVHYQASRKYKREV